MKLSGTAALMQERLAEFVAAQKAELAENKEFLAQLEAYLNHDKLIKKVKTRKPRTPKALPYDGVIGKVNGGEPQPWQYGSGAKVDAKSIASE